MRGRESKNLHSRGRGSRGAGQCGPLMRMQKGQGESQGGLGGAGSPWERTHRTIPATRVGSPLRDPLPLPSCTLGAEQAPVQARETTWRGYVAARPELVTSQERGRRREG